MEELYLRVTYLDDFYEDIELVNANGNLLTNFTIEFSKDQICIISYDTERAFQNKGYASIGLKMVSEKLFSSQTIDKR